jgi:hypothetical protein
MEEPTKNNKLISKGSFNTFSIILRMEVIYQKYFSDFSSESSSLYMPKSMVRWFIFGLLEPILNIHYKMYFFLLINNLRVQCVFF